MQCGYARLGQPTPTNKFPAVKYADSNEILWNVCGAKLGARGKVIRLVWMLAPRELDGILR
jgi:hypothetical protein